MNSKTKPVKCNCCNLGWLEVDITALVEEKNNLIRQITNLQMTNVGLQKAMDLLLKGMEVICESRDELKHEVRTLKAK